MTLGQPETPDRVCSYCHELLPIEDFPLRPPNSRVLRGSVCLGCLIAHGDEWRDIQRERGRRARARKRERHRERDAALAAEAARQEAERRERERGCQRKQGYDTQRAALAAAIRSSGHAGKPMNTYRCRFCESWHLTSKVKVVRG